MRLCGDGGWGDPGVDTFSYILRSLNPDFLLTADTIIAAIFSYGAMDFSKITIFEIKGFWLSVYLGSSLKHHTYGNTSQRSILLASTRCLFVFTDSPLVVARVYSCCTGIHWCSNIFIRVLLMFTHVLLMFYSCSTRVHLYSSVFVHLCTTRAPSCSYSCGVSTRSFYKEQFV